MLPLLFFYLTTVIALSTRIYTLIWIVDDYVCGRIFNFYFPMVCKLIVGYTQVWTITELTVRVKQCVKALCATQYDYSADNYLTSTQDQTKATAISVSQKTSV